MAAFAKQKATAIKRYKDFVAQGKDQASPWCRLHNQVFLVNDEFVENLQELISREKDLSEVPSSQRRAKALELVEYESQAGDRNEAIYNAYKGGGYTQK